ncbi:MAG: hypothetical protein HYW34_03845 [Candidatus Brennerbacteria bacterium]|nr:hypothetical protein [Candidatus Brennerbacteria bacterium]
MKTMFIKLMKLMKLKANEGQSTLEILIALAILIISVSTTIVVLFGSQSVSVDTKLNQEAISIARQSLENARSSARQNFDALLSSSSTTGEFLKETIVTAIDQDTKQITSRISWKTDPLRPQKVEFTTIATDWRNITPPADPGDTGGGGVTGNWCNPQTLGSIDLGPGNSGTDLDVIGKIVYMSAEASADAKPDFFVIDVSNSQSPSIISNLNTGTGINALDASANYVYAANKSVTAQLQIIDVTSSSSPSLINSFQLPGVSGAGAIGQSIFYLNSKVYIGTKTATGPEFHIIDVSTPSSPIALGSREVGNDVNGIFVSSGTAYIANSHSNELKVFNVSNPSNITEIASYDMPGNTEDGKTVYAVGNRLYFGRLVGGNHDDHHEFHIFDVSNPSGPLNLGSKDLAANLNDLVIRDNLGFFATSDPNQEVQIWNISNPANITLCSAFNFPQSANGIDYENNLVYVAVRSNDALRIITSQ